MKFKNVFFLVATMSLAACSPPTFGLKPLYPEIICSKGDCAVNCVKEDCVVDSLRPVLRWEAFLPADKRPDEKQMSKIRTVTYDLNIWLSENDSPSCLIYSRRGLPEPRHEVEEPLLPCASYFWTVRARFLVDGKEKVSEWGVSSRPRFWQDPSKSYGPIKESISDELVRRSPVVPHPNLYRFMAPCPEQAEGRRTPRVP